jgi:catechol 2,3-dioxygenase-like lactoylglutathione lyase family enzyme
MLDHVSIQCGDVAASAAFYDAVLAPIGGSRALEHDDVVGYGLAGQLEFVIGSWQTGEGFRESHIAFTAPDRSSVRAFFDAAVATGAQVLYEPKVWPQYHENYYAAFVRDPDGNNVEAVSHVPE